MNWSPNDQLAPMLPLSGGHRARAAVVEAVAQVAVVEARSATQSNRAPALSSSRSIGLHWSWANGPNSVTFSRWSRKTALVRSPRVGHEVLAVVAHPLHVRAGGEPRRPSPSVPRRVIAAEPDPAHRAVDAR